MQTDSYHSLVDVIEQRARQDPHRLALVILNADGSEQKTTCGEVDADARTAALQMSASGIGSGDVVLLAMDHSYNLVRTFLGALYLGALPGILRYYNPAKAELYAARLRQQAQQVGARAVITLPEFRVELAGRLADVACVVLDRQHDEATPPTNESRLRPSQGGSAAYLQFTTGTTGLSKAAVLSHRAVLDNAVAMVARLAFNERDVFLSWSPFSHPLTISNNLWLPFVSEGLSVTISPERWLRRPATLFQVAHRYRCTMLSMPNFGYQYCALRVREQDLQGVDLSSLRIVLNASEVVSTRSMRAFAERFGPYGFNPNALCACYGMSEHVAAVSVKQPDRPLRTDWVSTRLLKEAHQAVETALDASGARPIVSCGAPLDGVAVRIVDDADTSLPERRVGEVLLRSTCLFSGYYGRPDLTAAALRDGWFHTGDLGYLADGELYICGRKKDVIIVAGRNISPEPIEEIALSVLGERGRRAAAFGVYDDTLGTEAPVLVCDYAGSPSDAQREQDEREIRRRVAADLEIAPRDVYFAPKGWVIHEDLKLARAANREKYLAERGLPALAPLDGTDADVQDSMEDQLTHLFEQLVGQQPVGLHDSFFDLGGDSLLALQLILIVEERFDKSVPPEFFREPTVAHLTRLLREHTEPAEARAAQVRTVPAPNRSRPWRGLLRTATLQLLYPAHLRLLRWVCRQPWAQQRWFGEAVDLIRRFYATLDNPASPLDEVIALSLLGHTRRQWRIRVLSRAAPRQFERWVSVTGEHIVRHAHQQRRGVMLLLTHDPHNKVLLSVLHRLGYDDIAGIRAGINLPPEAWRWDSAAWRQRRPAQDFLTSQVVAAHAVLQRGGLTVIAGDGGGGYSHPVTLSFHGRQRPFRTGFAALAATTGAAVVPVHTVMDRRGKIHITFLSPLDTNSGGPRSTEWVNRIVLDYATLLRDQWAQFPWIVRWIQMRHHLALPLAEDRAGQ